MPSLAVLLLIALPVASGTSGPTLAREDTLSTAVPEVLVTAPRVTLEEILARVARGEAHRDSLVRDQSYRATLRMLGHTVGAAEPKLVVETVYQIYRKRPDKLLRVVLREWKLDDKKAKKGARSETSVSTGSAEEIVNFAFQASAHREFKYEIVGRELVGGHLIYRIAFEPRVSLDPTMPSGRVWIDTNDFVILHQEIHFNRSPMPMFLKSIDRMVVERQRVGDVWVLKRVLARAETTIPLPKIGRAFDFAIQYDDYAINTELPDSLFVPEGRGGRHAGFQMDSK